MPVNVQVNPLDSLIQGFQTGMQLTPQAIQQRNLSNQLALQLQGLKVRQAQQALEDQLNPEAAVARKIKGQLAAESYNPNSDIVAVPTEVGASPIATPGAIGATEQDLLNQESGGLSIVPPSAPAGQPVNPIIGPSGAPTGYGSDLNKAILGATQQAKLARIKGQPQLENQIALAEARAKFGKPQIIQSVDDPTKLAFLSPGQELPEGFQPYIKPATTKSTGITGNEAAKAINEAQQVGIVYNPQEHGDLTSPAAYAKFKSQISDAGDVQGAITDAKLRPVAMRIQTQFNKEPVVQAKKNLEIFGKEAGDALQHIIDNPDEPAGARQIEAFDSFIKAFSAGKPTIAQYGQIEKYQSAGDYFTNLLQRISTGQRLTNQELGTYASALKDASASIDAPYRKKVKQYQDEAVANGIKRSAASKVIKSEIEDVLPEKTQAPTAPEGLKGDPLGLFK